MGKLGGTGQRLVALGLLGLILLDPPLLNTQSGASGLGAYVYLFAAWGLVILLAAWVAEGRKD